MNETATVVGSLIAGIGTVVGAVKYLATKLTQQYEHRIAALEKATDECNADRKSLHREYTALQQQWIHQLTGTAATR